MRIFEYTISQTQDSVMIKDYLKGLGFSAQSMIVLKKKPGNVIVNDMPVFLTYRLKAGDHLVIRLAQEISSEHIEPVELPLDIIYEDEDLFVLNKPADMPIHPSINNYDNSLANALAWHYAKKKEPFVFRCINRLDRDTSGLTIVAKNMVSAGILSSMIARKQEGGIIREYLAIVRGCPSPTEGTINAPIARKEGSIMEREVNFEQGEPALTHYRLVRQKNGHSLISLLLETGRTHQIRVHMKYIGYPLIGDYLYNPDTEHMSRQALHAYRLKFRHPITGEELEFTAPLPEDMQWMES